MKKNHTEVDTTVPPKYSMDSIPVSILRALATTATDGICTVNEDGEITHINQGLLKIHNRTIDQMLGEPFINFVPPEQHSHLEQQNRERREGNPAPFEIEIIRPDGERRRLLIGHQTFDDNGKSVMGVILKDITERHLLEQKLKEANERLSKKVERKTNELLDAIQEIRAEGTKRIRDKGKLKKLNSEVLRLNGFLDDSPAMIFLWQIADGWPIINVSENVEEILGYTPEDFIANRAKWEEVTHPDDLRRCNKETLRYIEERIDDFSQEYRLIAKDGHIVWVEDRNRLIVDENDELTHIQAIVHDISGRKKLEQARIDSENRYSMLMEESTDAIFVCTANGELSECNLRMKKLLTRIDCSIEKTNVCDFFTSKINERDHKFEEAILIGEEAETILTFPTVDNSMLYLEIRARMIPSGDVLCVIRDITERTQLQREMTLAAGAERLRLGEQLHDSVGQQLTGISYMVHNLEKSGVVRDGERPSELENISKLLRESISQIRAISRGLCPVDLVSEGLFDSLKQLTKDTQSLYGMLCHIKKRGSGEIYDSEAATALYWIAHEAITNALRHGKPTEINITLSTDNINGKLIIADNGSGFSRDKNGQNDSLGIKLMYYRAGIINGTLEFSEEAKGTKVICRFPNIS